MQKGFLLLSLLFLGFKISVAQQPPSNKTLNTEIGSGMISGKVIDENLKKPVEYANVVLYNELDSVMITGTITDMEGSFQLEKIPFGSYYIVVNFIGYEKKYISGVKLEKGKKLVSFAQILLKQASADLDGVEITAEKTYIEYKIDKKVVNIGKDVTSTGGSVVDALKNVPSVHVDIDGTVTLRGNGDFQVLIDGKPTVMSPNDVLKQIPASIVQNIEIITNPSAKYDPEGVSGIINIILKKEKRDGFNGIVNTSIGSGDKYNGDFLINYRRKKINVFIGANYNSNSHTRNSTTDRRTTFSDTISNVFSTTDRSNKQFGYNIKAGIDYNINDKNTISLSSDFGHWGFNRNFESFYHEYTSPLTDHKYFIVDDGFDIGGNYSSVNLFYKRDFKEKGQELTVNTFYSRWDGKNDQLTYKYLSSINESISENMLEKSMSLEDNYRDEFVFKLDYTKPIKKKHKLESGYHFRTKLGEADYNFGNYDTIANIWVDDTVYSNEIYFQRDVHSIYSTFSSSFKGFDYMLGMRLEYTYRLIDQKTTNEQYKLDRFDFFPSVHISKKLPKKMQLQFSYSRRINRPQEWFLNPFPDYSDDYIVSHGNPNLLPALIDSYQLSIVKRLKTSFVSAELYYRQRNDMMTRTVTVDENNVAKVTFDNMNRGYETGLELVSKVNLKKWWSIFGSVNLYNYRIEGQIIDTEVSKSTETWFARANNTIKFSANTFLQIDGMYVAPSISAQGKQKEYYVLNAGIKHDFMKHKASFNFNVRDILQTAKHDMTFEENNSITNFEMAGESPVFMISFSYRINNYRKASRKEEQIDMNFNGGGMN